ncbi:unnamed protein product [Closterium sp. Naga37s-1]|nr:unnamed protein product [Closterium sp. Naga37s-1]
MGYAASARINGGRFRPRYVVTTSFDSADVSQVPVGSLRWALQYLTDGAYIAFDASMDVWLQADLFVPSFVTIDGQGAQVRILNGTLVLSGARDVIIHNVEVAGQPRGSLITLYGCKRVWIDHCSLYDAAGAIIEGWHGTTDMTISNNYIRNSLLASRVIQMGIHDADPADATSRVTIFRNWFDASTSMQPLCRRGVCHVANNLYTSWSGYCLAARRGATVWSESNFFRPGHQFVSRLQQQQGPGSTGKLPLEVTTWRGGMGPLDPDFDPTVVIRSVGDYLLDGATFHEWGRVKSGAGGVGAGGWVQAAPLFPYVLSLLSNTSRR